MRVLSKRWRSLSLGMLATAGLLGAIVLLVRGAVQRVPAFYEAAETVPLEVHRQAGRELERTVVAWHNDAGTVGPWSLRLTDQQVNGWLATEMADKFPGRLPDTVRDPRVAFTPQDIRLACRYDGPPLTAVIQLTLQIHVAEEPNTLAIRLRRARAGLLPLPLDGLLDQISEAARQADVILNWGQTDGDPVALITLGELRGTQANQTVSLESLEVRDGEIELAGHTQRVSHTAAGKRAAPPLGDPAGDQSGVNSTRQR
jgi:hypothetical protein